MSNDERTEFDDLERVLRAHQPVPLPSGLQKRLTSASLQSSSFADRVFELWTSAGAIAACAVVAITVWQFSTRPAVRAASPEDVAQQQQMIQQYRQILAMQ